jgi:ankyrin repeat protein
VIGLQDDEGRTALHWAADAGQADVAQALLDKGADLEAKVRSQSACM